MRTLPSNNPITPLSAYTVTRSERQHLMIPLWVGVESENAFSGVQSERVADLRRHHSGSYVRHGLSLRQLQFPLSLCPSPGLSSLSIFVSPFGILASYSLTHSLYLGLEHQLVSETAQGQWRGNLFIFFFSSFSTINQSLPFLESLSPYLNPKINSIYLFSLGACTIFKL